MRCFVVSSFLYIAFYFRGFIGVKNATQPKGNPGALNHALVPEHAAGVGG
jgi:hypothetical protein